MILTEGDVFFSDDDLQPFTAGTLNGRTMWEMHRIRRVESIADEVHENGSERSADDKELMSIEDVMKELKMGKSWTYRRIKDGDIPSLRMGNNIKVRREDLIRWIEEQRV